MVSFGCNDWGGCALMLTPDGGAWPPFVVVGGASTHDMLRPRNFVDTRRVARKEAAAG